MTLWTRRERLIAAWWAIPCCLVGWIWLFWMDWKIATALTLILWAENISTRLRSEPRPPL